MSKQQAANNGVGHHDGGEGNVLAQSPGGEQQVSQVERGIGPAEDGLGGVVFILPPAQLNPQLRGSRAQPHICQPYQRHDDVEADGMAIDALLSELIEPGIERPAT